MIASWSVLVLFAQIPIWPVPPARHPERPESTGTATTPVGGRPWVYVTNVSVPTVTVYPPTAANTGAAAIVFPGGGYQILAIDLEGTEVCDWLVARGIMCVLLKYRVPNQGPGWDQPCGCNLRTHSSMALEDAQRAVSFVRFHAAEWHVDPHKIGVIGFSAGGHLVASVSTRFIRRVYRPVDDADRESSRPDFAIAVYPGHLYDYRRSRLNRDLAVTREVPPTMIVHAENDNVDGPTNAIAYYVALKDAGVPAELHLFARGRHAFGLRPTSDPITGWPRLAEAWLTSIGMTTR